MSLVAVADVYGLSRRRSDLLRLVSDAERDAAGKAGCLRYSFAETIAGPDHFVLVSEWQGQAALDAHYGSAGVRELPVRAQRRARAPERDDGVLGQRVNPAACGRADGSARRGLT